MGSWLIQEIRAEYHKKGVNYSYAEIESTAEKAAPFAWFIDVDDEVFFTPGNIPGKIQENCRERYGNAPEDIGALARCVYESIAMKYRRNLEILEKVTGACFGVINITGGGSRDALMCRFTADVCNRPVVAGPTEATALGNMLVQLMSAGEIATVKEGRAVIAASYPPLWYEPSDTARWEEAYGRYSALFPRN
jgi:sugar (pentulose or hexulose) kinase